MFQDIAPKVFDNHYEQRRAPRADDYVVIYNDRQVVMYQERALPTVQKATAQWQLTPDQMTYLFQIDQTAFYLVAAKITPDTDYHYTNARAFRNFTPAWLGYAGATAAHLGWWYETNQFCGRCGHAMVPDQQERAMDCPQCGQKIYPRISPVVVVGVTSGDKILLTKYLTGYQPYTLISGFVEIGETLEDTVRREVHEEVGLDIRNIHYYGSQPWAFSESLLMGFFAELDHPETIQLEHDELSQAKWFDRNDTPDDGAKFILAWEMRQAFRNAQA